jgi:hypothetical protein
MCDSFSASSNYCIFMSTSAVYTVTLNMVQISDFLYRGRYTHSARIGLFMPGVNTKTSPFVHVNQIRTGNEM